MSVPDYQRCNIGARGVRKRWMLGIPLAVIGIVASFMSKSFLGQAVAFFGFLGMFQAQEGVCVALASRGARNMDEGMQPLERTEDVEYFNKRKWRIYWKTFFATLFLMLAGRAYLYFF